MTRRHRGPSCERRSRGWGLGGGGWRRLLAPDAAGAGRPDPLTATDSCRRGPAVARPCPPLPRSPPMVAPEVEERKPACTTATTCNAGMCDEAESETEVDGEGGGARARLCTAGLHATAPQLVPLSFGIHTSTLHPVPPVPYRAARRHRRHNHANAGFEASSREQAKRRGAGSGACIAAGDADRLAVCRLAGRFGGGGGARRGGPAAQAAATAAAAAAVEAAAAGAGAAGVVAPAAGVVGMPVAQPAGAAGGSAPQQQGAVPPPPPLRNALNDSIFHIGTAPESAEAVATVVAAAALPSRRRRSQQQQQGQGQQQEQQQQQLSADAAAAPADGAGPSGSGGVAGPRRRAPAAAVASPGSVDTAHALQTHAGPVLRSERRRAQPAPDASGGSAPAPAQRGAAPARRAPRASRQQQHQQQQAQQPQAQQPQAQQPQAQQPQAQQQVQQQVRQQVRQQHSQDGAGVSGETPPVRPGAQTRRRRPQHQAEDEEEEEQRQPSQRRQQPGQQAPPPPAAAQARARSGAKRQRTGDVAPAWEGSHPADPPSLPQHPPQQQAGATSGGRLKGLLKTWFTRSQG